MSLISIENLSVYYDRVCALENINLQINERDFLGIIGPNGGGKTTFIKVLLGLIKAKEGNIQLNECISIGYVPQFSVFDKTFPISVIEVILMGRLKKKIRVFHKYSKEDVKKAEQVMMKLGIHHLKNRQISQLSGGQLQRVLIARALVTEPKILILDEPTASLDTDSRTEIYELLSELNKDVTIIVVSHDLDILPFYAKSIVSINKSLTHIGDSQLENEKIINSNNIINRQSSIVS